MPNYAVTETINKVYWKPIYSLVAVSPPFKIKSLAVHTGSLLVPVSMFL